MEIRTRDPNGSVGQIYGAIATAAAKGKFVDFRDSLSLAYLEDYANIQGVGGADSTVSGIKVLIQDYSKKPSVNASAILPCFMVDKLLEICKANIAAPVFETPEKPANEKAYVYNGISYVSEMVTRSFHAFAKLTKGMMNGCARLLKGTAVQGGAFAEFGGSLKKATAILNNQQSGNTFPANTPYMEYSYHQNRVYAGKDDKGRERAFVTLFDISRKQFNKEGRIAMYPWTITINQFKADPRKHDNGTVTYNPRGPKEDEKQLFFQMSDSDMWRCLYAVQHYISVWEMAYGIPLVQNGIAAHEYQKQNYHQAQQQNQQRPAPQQSNGGQNQGYGAQNNAGGGQYQNDRSANNYNGGNNRW